MSPTISACGAVAVTRILMRRSLDDHDVTWALMVPLLASAQTSTPAPTMCPVSTPVRADAPRDANADPMSGYGISATSDRVGPGGCARHDSDLLGRYRVRPAGTPLVFIARPFTNRGRQRCQPSDRDIQPVLLRLDRLPGDGRWEITAHGGELGHIRRGRSAPDRTVCG
jgi:hypothetical protein